MNFRDLIDRLRMFPYKISYNCFVDKFRNFIGDKQICQMCADSSTQYKIIFDRNEFNIPNNFVTYI